MPKSNSVKSFKTKLVLWIVVFLFVFVLFAIVVWFSWPKLSVVYLDTGDIYFGKLAFLPLPYLKDAWALQRDQTAGIALIPVSDTFWKPKKLMFLSFRHIVFWSEISPDSAANQAIKSGGQNIGNQGSGNSNTSAEPLPSSTP